MLHQLFEIIKYLITKFFPTCLDQYILYMFFSALWIFFMLIFIVIIKINKDIKKLDERKRIRDKNLLKSISNNKNNKSF